MHPLHARYPFLDAARESVESTDVSLPALVAREAPAVARGRERVERALLEGTVASESPEEWSPADELLSYPIARILVSLLDSSAAVQKYAAAEAATARERLVEDLERGGDGLRSSATPTLDRGDLLEEFDLADAVEAEPLPRESARGPDRYRVSVGTYLRLSDPDWSDRWRLVNRELDAGTVRVEREELDRLLGEAIRRRVVEGLPFEGLEEGEGIAADLEAQLEDLRRLLSQRTEVGTIDVVVRELFPPCVENLLQKAESETALDAYESFALMAFLCGIGMSPEEIVAFCGQTSLDPEGIRYQTEFLRDDRGTQYPPPSCETLNSYGICHNEDDHWRVASHPLAYYRARLDEADDEELVDWRESRSA